MNVTHFKNKLGDLTTATKEANKTIVTNQDGSMTVDLGFDEFCKRLQRWLGGQLIQHAFPELSADQREFLMTGITPEKWDVMFKERE